MANAQGRKFCMSWSTVCVWGSDKYRKTKNIEFQNKSTQLVGIDKTRTSVVPQQPCGVPVVLLTMTSNNNVACFLVEQLHLLRKRELSSGTNSNPWCPYFVAMVINSNKMYTTRP